MIQIVFLKKLWMKGDLQNSIPQPGDYGEFAAENYDLMKCLLED